MNCLQGPRSNFEMGGHDSDSIMGLKYWGGGGHKSPANSFYFPDDFYVENIWFWRFWLFFFLSNF